MADPAVRVPIPALSSSEPLARGGSRSDVIALPIVREGPERFDGIAVLVQLAVDNDDAGGLVEAAASALGAPLGLAAITGERLAHAPHDAVGRRALAVAAAAARQRGASPPAGWRVLPIRSGRKLGAILAVGADAAGDASGPLLDVIVALLGEQLLRSSLRRSQVAAFLRRLVGDPDLGARRAREEATPLGLTLPEPCWTALVAWDDGALRSADLDRVARDARRMAPGSVTATGSDHMVLLHPTGGPARDVIDWVERVLMRLRALAPHADTRAVVADGPVALGAVATEVAGLTRLSRHPVPGDESRPVTRARQYALDILLRESVAPLDARRYIDDLVGALIAWDHEHRSDLLRVLEAALDSPRHDDAARRCFMHRNTFRHRLHRALDVLGDDLTDPETRLAVHVALKLRRVVGSDAADSASSASPRRPGATPTSARRAVRA